MSKSLVEITNNEPMTAIKKQSFVTPVATIENARDALMCQRKGQTSAKEPNVDLETRSFSDLVSDIIRSTQRVDEKIHSRQQSFAFGTKTSFKGKHFLRVPEPTNKFSFFNARFHTQQEYMKNDSFNVQSAES